MYPLMAGNPMERAAAAKPHATLHIGFLASPGK